MITLLLTLAAGGCVFVTANWAVDMGLGWSIFMGVAGAVVSQVLVGGFIQKRVKRDMESVQAVLVEGQKKLQAKMQRWQMRPPGSLQAAQKEIAADTQVFVKEALARTGVLEKYRRWVPMMDRQIATARLQLSWMIKDFRAVDALMPKALLIDPTMAAIKMSRMQMTGADIGEIRKLYRKASSRVRYNQNVLLAAAMSWIEIKRGDVDGAFKTLTEALKKSDNETLKQNHAHLMNNRPAHFSNSGLGEQWYSLLLEEPKVRMQRQRQAFR
jgi:hypothetical protein